MRQRIAVLQSMLVSPVIALIALAAGNAQAQPAKPMIEKIAKEISAERIEKTIRKLVLSPGVDRRRMKPYIV